MEKIELDLHKDLDKTKYIFIPIGINCKTGLFLRNCGIKCFTYPYDWASETSIDEILDVLNNYNNFNINTWFRFTDLNYYLPHDKLNDSHGEEENAFLNTDLIAKYNKRFERLFLDIKKPNVILIRYFNEINDKISLIQKEKFREINNSISFIEINNFTLNEIESESIYKDYLLSLFKPNTYTVIIKEVIYILGEINFPITYSTFYNNINYLTNKYKLDTNIFPNDNCNILFNSRKDLISFLGICLTKQFAEIEIFG